MSAEALARLRTAWLPACSSKQLKRRPIARTVLGTHLALFRSHNRAAALIDRCPHRGAPLSQGRIVKDLVRCPYHGWSFDGAGICKVRPGISTEEMSQSIPHCANATAIDIHEQDGLVWVRLDSTVGNVAGPVRRPWFTDNEFGSFCWTHQIEAEFVDAIENLLDATHTPFVHAGWLRREDKPQHIHAVVRASGDQIEAEYTGEQRQNGWVSRLLERDRTKSIGRFVPPCIAELEYHSARGPEFVLVAYFTPSTATSILLHLQFFLRRGVLPTWIKGAVVAPIFRVVLRQDRKMLQMQQKNVCRFEARRYCHWEGDLLRGGIESWLRTGVISNSFIESEVQLSL